MKLPLDKDPQYLGLLFQHNSDYIAKNDLVDGGLYIIYGRSAYIGLWLAAKDSFTVPRCKFASWSLFEESHWDDEYFDDKGKFFNRGTAQPLSLIACSLENNDLGLLDFLKQLEKDNPIVEGWDSIEFRYQSDLKFVARLTSARLARAKNNNKLPVYKAIKRKEKMSIRKLSDAFVNDLKEGLLKPFVDQVRKDDTLLLCIRNGYINIYYRGGNILEIKEKARLAAYDIFFNVKYSKDEQLQELLPNKRVSNAEAAELWVGAIPLLKQAMDYHFSGRGKLEREFQQLVVRENNTSRISNDTEYFITDIELAVRLPADGEVGEKVANFDLVGIQWDINKRRALDKCKPVLIEMKYGDKSLVSGSGVEEHAHDISRLTGNNEILVSVIETIEYQYNLLADLGLVRINQKGRITLDKQSNLEVIFLLANTVPGGKVLRDVIIADTTNTTKEQKDMPLDELDKNPKVDLKLFVANFAGYGLYKGCMKTLEEFKKLINSKI